MNWQDPSARKEELEGERTQHPQQFGGGRIGQKPQRSLLPSPALWMTECCCCWTPGRVYISVSTRVKGLGEECWAGGSPT